VLVEDVTITEPLALEGVLDCRGHRISVSTLGSPDYASTEANEYAPSVPEVGILQFGTSKLTVQDCVLDGFDFGILIANSKGRAAKTRVFNSTIVNGYYGIRVLRSDHVLIRDNTIHFGDGARGKGVWVQSDSDNVRIIDNHITAGAIDEDTNIPLLPGGQQLWNCRPDGVRTEIAGVRDGALFGLSLMNMIVDGELTQFAYKYPSSTFDSSQWQEGLLVLGNVVTPGPSTGTFAISMGGGAVQPWISFNEVRNGGIHFSGPEAEEYTIPGSCSLDGFRACASDTDCFIPEIDSASLGTCDAQVLTTTQGIENGYITDNITYGPFFGASQYFGANLSTFPNSENAMIAGNTVYDSPVGIFLWGRGPITNARIKRNVLDANGFGLQLWDAGWSDSAPAATWSSVFSLNDVVGSTTAGVASFGGYALLTELSFRERGNYWGHTCAEGSFQASDATFPQATDGYSYGEPVANTPYFFLPEPCSE
jgi:nitrous oxidase accessory protein NosD